LPKERIESVIELIGQLERLSDVGEIMKLLSGNSISKHRS
jgi:hypothetical protein